MSARLLRVFTKALRAREGQRGVLEKAEEMKFLLIVAATRQNIGGGVGRKKTRSSEIGASGYGKVTAAMAEAERTYFSRRSLRLLMALKE